jgi:hypothetical protein
MPKPNVYTYWDSSEHADPSQASILRLWVRSWSARGWSPRILTVRNAAKHPRFDVLGRISSNLPHLAAEVEKVRWLVPIEAMNFSFTPAMHRKSGTPRIHHFHSVGWESAPVVDFPNVHDADLIEHCGRPL